MLAFTSLLFAVLSLGELANAAHIPRRHNRARLDKPLDERSPVVRGLPGSVSNTEATWYSLVPEEGGYFVHCDGTLSPDPNSYFVAMNTPMFDMSQCGQQITISYGGKTATATILDSCPSCHTYGQLDMSEGLMRFFDPGMTIGVLKGVSWTTGGGGGEAPPPKEEKTSTSTTPEWTPEPTPSPTPSPTPEPSTSSTETSTTESSTESSSSSTESSSAVPSSSSALPSSSSAALNSSIALSSSSLPLSASSSHSLSAAIASITGTAKNATAGDLTVDTGAQPANGNIAGLSGLIATLGRMIIVASQ